MAALCPRLFSTGGLLWLNLRSSAALWEALGAPKRVGPPLGGPWGAGEEERTGPRDKEGAQNPRKGTCTGAGTQASQRLLSLFPLVPASRRDSYEERKAPFSGGSERKGNVLKCNFNTGYKSNPKAPLGPMPGGCV